MNILDIILTIFSIVSASAIVLLVIFVGWFLVWKFFLSRYRLIRELISGVNDSASVSSQEIKTTRTKKTRKD